MVIIAPGFLRFFGAYYIEVFLVRNGNICFGFNIQISCQIMLSLNIIVVYNEM